MFFSYFRVVKIEFHRCCSPWKKSCRRPFS